MSVVSTPGRLEKCALHGGNRTFMTFGILAQCQPSYTVRSVRVYDISELSLVLSISMQSNNHDIRGGMRDQHSDCMRSVVGSIPE
jgi:hypothetical protein